MYPTPVPLAAAGGLFLTVLLFLVVAAVGTAMHASDHGRSPALWFLIVLFTGVVGILVYVVMDDGRQRQFQCPHCGYWNGGGARYCGGCGSDVGTQQPRGPGSPQQTGGAGHHGATNAQRRRQSPDGPGPQNRNRDQQPRNQQQDDRRDGGFDT